MQNNAYSMMSFKYIFKQVNKTKPYVYWHMYVISIKTHIGKLNTEFRIVVMNEENEIEMKSV